MVQFSEEGCIRHHASWEVTRFVEYRPRDFFEPWTKTSAIISTVMAPAGNASSSSTAAMLTAKEIKMVLSVADLLSNVFNHWLPLLPLDYAD